MMKKLMSVLLSLIILMFSATSIYAEDYVKGIFFYRNVMVNGTEFVNYNLQYPVVLYSDTTYIPLSDGVGEVFGFKADWNKEDNSLTINKIPCKKTVIDENWTKNQGEDLEFKVLQNISVYMSDEEFKLCPKSEDEKTAEDIKCKIEDSEEVLENSDENEQNKKEENKDLVEKVVQPETENLEIDKSETAEVKGAQTIEIDMKGLPVLEKDGYTYVPLKIFRENEIFAWDLYYDSNFGICISSKKGIEAKTFYNENEARYIKGLSAYILKYNKVISPSQAQKLVFQFKRAAKVNEVDEKILMAMAHKESTFNAGAVSRGGARGIMQLMPRTGANFGMNYSQMLDPRLSINAGASMMRAGLNKFDGSTEKALSAYNQGSYRVSRGNYSTRYANKVTKAYNSMNTFLTTNGYM